MPTQRSRGWRRAQARHHRRGARAPDAGETQRAIERGFPRWKLWREISGRSAKHARAKQLGRLWPPREWRARMTEETALNVLFICSQNQWRSPTAERVWARVPGVNARSAGTARSARRTVTVRDIRWADLILVMEDKHASRLRADFRDEMRYKAIHVLDIPDDYRFMEPELVELVREKAAGVIEAARG